MKYCKSSALTFRSRCRNRVICSAYTQSADRPDNNAKPAHDVASDHVRPRRLGANCSRRTDDAATIWRPPTWRTDTRRPAATHDSTCRTLTPSVEAASPVDISAIHIGSPRRIYMSILAVQSGSNANDHLTLDSSNRAAGRHSGRARPTRTGLREAIEWTARGSQQTRPRPPRRVRERHVGRAAPVDSARSNRLQPNACRTESNAQRGPPAA